MMLRQAAKLALPACQVALRGYAAAPRLSTTASLRPHMTALHGVCVAPPCLSTRASACINASAMTTVSHFSLVQRRRSSTTTTDAEKANTSGASVAAALAPVSTPVEQTPSPTPSVAEQLSALSKEDQQRIIAALQQPEKEKSSVMGGAGIGPADGDMVAAFTCGPCNYRMVKRFSKHAYTKGIVIVECPNCRAKHLLADNLGWLEDEARNIEDILHEKGESFTRIGGTTGDFQVVGKEEEEDAAALAAASTSTPPSPGAQN
jgi:mitochondrial protein import protein ZIM17